MPALQPYGNRCHPWKALVPKASVGAPAPSQTRLAGGAPGSREGGRCHERSIPEPLRGLGMLLAIRCAGMSRAALHACDAAARQAQVPFPAGPSLGLPEGRPHGVGPTKPSREAVNFIRACIQAAKPGKLLNICSPPKMDPLLHGGAPPSTVLRACRPLCRRFARGNSLCGVQLHISKHLQALLALATARVLKGRPAPPGEPARRCRAFPAIK